MSEVELNFDLDKIYAAALLVEPKDFQSGNAKFEHFVKLANPNAVCRLIDEIKQLSQKLNASEADNLMAKNQLTNLRATLRIKESALTNAEKAIREAQEQKPDGWLHKAYATSSIITSEVKNLLLDSNQYQVLKGRELVIDKSENYTIPLYRAPVPAMPIQDDKLVNALNLAVYFIESLRVPQNTNDASIQLNSGAAVLAKAREALNKSEVNPS